MSVQVLTLRLVHQFTSSSIHRLSTGCTFVVSWGAQWLTELGRGAMVKAEADWDGKILIKLYCCFCLGDGDSYNFFGGCGACSWCQDVWCLSSGLARTCGESAIKEIGPMKWQHHKALHFWWGNDSWLYDGTTVLHSNGSFLTIGWSPKPQKWQMEDIQQRCSPWLLCHLYLSCVPSASEP